MIIGERIRLRRIEKSDLPRCVAWLNDPEVIENLSIYAPLSMSNEDHWFDEQSNRPLDEQPFVIEIKKDEQWIHIGNCGFHKLDGRIRSAEIGIFIGNKNYWDQGYGTETVLLMLKYGFEILNLNRIMLDVYETNRRAIRSYRKAGFVLEGRKRQGMYKNGEYFDVLIMSVLRGDWLSENARTPRG
jgi:RimJ/RimL family protein N-acetyltransferase